MSAWFRLYAPWPTVTFLSVGQADCAVVRHGATTILVDTGTPGAFSRSVTGYLRRQGISGVDLCIISHLHQDHVGGLPGLALEVAVGTVLVSPGSSDEVSALLAPTQASAPACRPEASAIVEAVSGTVYKIDRLLISVACPAETRPSNGDENSRSLVAVLETGEIAGPSIEFWGDAPEEEVSRYLSSYPSMFTGRESGVIVKVPHHGSQDALANGFYERPGMNLAVISVGTNSYGHPSNEVLEAAHSSRVRLLRTDLHGAITVTFTPFGVSVRSYR